MPASAAPKALPACDLLNLIPLAMARAKLDEEFGY